MTLLDLFRDILKHGYTVDTEVEFCLVRSDAEADSKLKVHRIQLIKAGAEGTTVSVGLEPTGG